MKYITINGIQLECNEMGLVMWSDQWENIHKLSPEYLDVKIYKHLNGHMEYIIKPKYSGGGLWLEV